jgi:hypothetical protein
MPLPLRRPGHGRQAIRLLLAVVVPAGEQGFMRPSKTKLRGQRTAEVNDIFKRDRERDAEGVSVIPTVEQPRTCSAAALGDGEGDGDGGGMLAHASRAGGSVPGTAPTAAFDAACHCCQLPADDLRGSAAGTAAAPLACCLYGAKTRSNLCLVATKAKGVARICVQVLHRGRVWDKASTCCMRNLPRCSLLCAHY